MGESLKALKKAEAEQKKAEETLRKKQHLNELLLDNLSHFEVIIHKDRLFLLANHIVREFGAKVGIIAGEILDIASLFLKKTKNKSMTTRRSHLVILVVVLVLRMKP